MAVSARQRIVILGGGFGGLYTALHLEKALGRGAPLEVTLVNRDNVFLFTPRGRREPVATPAGADRSLLQKERAP